MGLSGWLWKAVTAVTLAVTAVVVAVTVPTLLCHCGGDRNSSQGLEKALDVTNRNLAETRGQWQRCRKELGALEGKALELERALANVTRLEEQNRALGTEVTRQREQLGEEWSLRAQLQQQNRLLQEQLRDLQSQRSAGDPLPVSLGVPALLLLLLGMLLP